MSPKLNITSRTLITAVILVFITIQVNASPYPWFDFFYYLPGDTIRPTQTDRRGDPYNYPVNDPFFLKDTGFIKRNIEYDPVTKQYYVIEKIGDQYYRVPMSFSMKEFLDMKGRQDENEYFRKRASLLANLNRRQYKPKFNFVDDWVNRIVGNGPNSKIEIKPSGFVGLSIGYQGQKINNPTLPERSRNYGGLDFDMNSQFQVDANIGDKLKLPINYNTLANFNYENQLKLDYQGKEDEILKLFQAGNTSFTSKGTLIPGAQSLFGVKTQLQFGKLFVTTVFANQRSQRQSLGIQGGSSTQIFSYKADEYEENRHFLMSQYFRSNYNTAMRTLPLVNSLAQILRVEVWVTNRTGITTDTRDVVALMDLAESDPYGPWGGTGTILPPRNEINSLYSTILATPGARSSSGVTSVLTSLGLQPVQDFEKTFARKLLPSDYYFNPQVGFISLNQQLQPDEVLGVAYQYTFNGKVYQVGEFSTDVPPDSTGTTQPVIFLKLLKATSQRTNLPLWDLMMKNVYSVGFGQLDRSDFKLDVLYEEPSLGEKRYLPPADVSDPFKGQPLISLLNLDRLNNQNDPQPDGVFDFVEGFTVISSQSRIIFPVLEPFGRDLEYVYSGADSIQQREKYLFYPLYDTIKAIAQTYANLNRFKFVGKSKSGLGNSEYQLGFNIPRGSVTVSAGGQLLLENIDYEINYDLGSLKIINQAIINSGVPVSVNYENNATYGLQNRNYMAVRLDYLASKKFTIGGTIVRLGERPFFIKQNYGDDPIRNTMYGIDFDYQDEIPRLSRLLDKLPFYSTKANSSIKAYGEAAFLDPGHAKQIGKKEEGVIYIDDFEGTRTSIDLRFPLISWTHASTPQGATDANGNILFPEATRHDNLEYGYNRAKLAWYNIEQVLQESRNQNNPLRNNLAELSKPETRQVYSSEIFPNRSTDIGQSLITTFDLAFYPKEKGPYNFEYRNGRVNANGALVNPTESWGGLMRNIDQTDFETGNIEFIEFWLQDPFIGRPSSTGGELYFNLGNISEDILKDGKRLYENGLPTTKNPSIPVDNNTVWGRVPSNPIQVTNAFSNDPEDRPFQDVGYDGLTDDLEKTKFRSYIDSLAANFGTGSPIYQRATTDPSLDNFKNYRDPTYDQANAGILRRYKDVNNPHGNSPVSNNDAEFINAFTLYPDQEELNRDNTLNEVEEYFQYRVDLKPGMTPGTNFITDVREVDVNPADGSPPRKEHWYLFRIPISQYNGKVGNIPDFKSIRFIRMFLTGFEDSVVCRFGKLELIRNQWRRFTYEIDTTGQFKRLPTNDPTKTDVLAVNIEENDQREPVRYVQPPGIVRQQQLSNNNVPLLLNEQSLSLRVTNLIEGTTRGVFKTMNLDLRQYGKLKMFMHFEEVYQNTMQDDDVNAVIRIGNDFVSNYYEIRVPLKKTPWFTSDSLLIWPEANNLELDIQELVRLKNRRNTSGPSNAQYYSETIGDRKYAIIGNPNLGEVRGMFMGIENKKFEPISAEVWFNELRLSHLDEKGGWAAIGRLDITGADLFNLSISATARSTGFGTLEQRVNERSREDFAQIDVATNIDAGKLLPRKLGMQIPVYAGISRTSSTPEYDPYDLDIKLRDKIRDKSKPIRDSIRREAVDETTIKTLTLTNVRKLKLNNKKPQFWDISNFDGNYSYTKIQRKNPLIDHDEVTRTRGALGYNFAPQPKFIEPFKRLIKSNSKWLSFIKDFNFNYRPSQISVKADVFRQFGALQPKNVGGGPYKIPESYDKFFTFDRYYILRWDLTRSISLDYNAINNARIDEPFGRINTKQKKDTVRENFFKGGRNTRFHQDATFTYNFPTNKFPLIDWTSIRGSYRAEYDWIGASLLAKPLGNTITNGQTKNVTGDLNFEQLYNKSRFLRAVYSDAPKPPPNNNAVNNNTNAPKQTVKPADSLSKKEKRKLKRLQRKQTRQARKLQKQNRVPEVGGFVKGTARLITSLKRVGVQYTETSGTSLPGYLDSTKVLGQNWKSMQPGFDFILGYQPDTSWINQKGLDGVLSKDPRFNSLIQQRFDQRLNITALVQPVRNLNIDINLDKTFTKNYTEFFKDTSATLTEGFKRLNPYALGSFSISYISFQTLFKKFDPNIVSETFKQFETNRIFLSEKLGKTNPYNGPNPTPGADGFYQGYGRYAQDVIIPAFISAYTNKDPLSVSLIKNSNPKLNANPFNGLKAKPNWNITYNASGIKALEKVFTNFSIRHGYRSTLSMNSFNSALFFQDPFRYGFPSFIDPLTNNYVPYFFVPNVTITEEFSPLLAVDMTFTNRLSARMEYRKTRQLSLSLIDYQLAENRSTELTVGADWTVRGMPWPKKIGKMKLDNDVTFRLDFSVRDDATANSKLDQNTSFGTAGQKVININPTIDYIVNSRIRATLFFSQQRTIPKIATTAPITNTRAGLQLTISLAQ